MNGRGRLIGVGVGPGDPELMTLKAARKLDECRVVGWFRAARRHGNARRIVEGRLRSDCVELELVYPVTTEAVGPDRYETLLADFYDESAKRVAEVLDAGEDVAVLCEGDPMLYGSYMYLHTRLADRYPTEIVPGVSSLIAVSSAISTPLAARNEVLTVLSGILDVDTLAARIMSTDAAVIMKVGRNLERVWDAVARAGRFDDARYVEWVSTGDQVVLPLAEVQGRSAPYFSMVVIPGPAAGLR